MKKNILFIFHSTYNFSAFALHIRELIIGTRDVVLWDFYFISLYYYSCIFSSLLYVVLRCPFYYITFCLPFSKQFFFFGSSSSIYIFAVLGGTFYHATSFVVCYIIIIWPSQRANGRASERPTDRPSNRPYRMTEFYSVLFEVAFFAQNKILTRNTVAGHDFCTFSFSASIRTCGWMDGHTNAEDWGFFRRFHWFRFIISFCGYFIN